MDSLTLDEARRLFGDRLVEPAHAARLLGGDPPPPLARDHRLPFLRTEAASAREAGCFLVHRPAHGARGDRVTLALLLARVGTGKASGFQGDDPWFGERLFAAAEAVEPGWALCHGAPWAETLNRTYAQASAIIAERGGGWRRRRAVEIAFDCFVVAAARGSRLLEEAWDWSSSESGDGGLVNAGGFSEKGLEVLSYSAPVKHGALGVCPTLVRADAR
jgi:hypothetical protein